MSINYDIWGQPENWNYYDQERYHDIRLPGLLVGQTAYRTLYRLVQNDALDENAPIDTSLCLSGMGSECPYSNITYVTVDNGEIKTDEQNRQLTNWIFYNCDNFGVYTAATGTTCLYKDGEGRKYRDFGQILTEYYNGNSEITPFIDFDYKKLVLLIRVVYSDAPNGTMYITDMDTYLSERYQAYPYVRYVCARLYYESGTNPTRRTYIQDGTIEGYHFCSSAILDDYTTTLTNEPLNRTYCNHIDESRGNNIPVMGLSYDADGTGLPASTHGRVFIFYGIDDNWSITKNDNNNDLYVSYHVTDINAFKEKALRAAAAFGCYFTGDRTIAEIGALTNEKMYIGVLDDNGIAHGDYLQGTATAQAKQNAWERARDSNYDPYAEVDKTKYKNDTEFYDSGLANGFTRFWVLDSTGVDALLSELYNIMSQDDPDESIERYNMKVFLTQNPIDAVISLKKFPLDTIPTTGVGPYRVQIGSKNTNISAYPLGASCGIYTFSFSSSDNTNLYPHYHKDFRDYEPYTKAELYVPFCGTYEIPCTYLYDYGGLVIKLVIDFVSGACTGYILVNGICIGSVSGNCAISLPLSGIQNATLDSQIHSAAIRDTQRVNSLAAGIAAGAVSIAAGLLTGGAAALAGVAGAALSIGTAAVKSSTEQAAINYEISHMQTPLKMVSTASGQIAHTYDMRAKLTVTRPKISADYDAVVYGNTIGFACLIDGIVSDFHGFTSGVINVDGIDATAEEKEMIRSAFASGVYLPNNE